MKKINLLALLIFTVLCVTACGSKDDTGAGTSGTSTTSTAGTTGTTTTGTTS